MGFDIPSSLGLPFVIRGFLPGVIDWLLIGYVLLPRLGYKVAVFSLEEQALLIVLVPLLVGTFLISLDYLIFTFFEGRFYWPKPVATRMIRRLQNQIDSLLNRDSAIRKDRATLQGLIESGKATKEQENLSKTLYEELGELWFILRQFPQEGDRRIAVYPTLMGNMLREAEEYTLQRYGMDSYFFWHRLKLLLPKDTLDLIDVTKSQSDFLVYTSFSLAIYSPIHLFVYVVAGKPFGALFGLVTLAMAYFLYRASLKGLRIYLEQFKSVFDTQREALRKLLSPTQIGEEERNFWDDVWRVLQYGKKLKRTS